MHTWNETEKQMENVNDFVVVETKMWDKEKLYRK